MAGRKLGRRGDRVLSGGGNCEACGCRVEYRRTPSGKLTARRLCEACLLNLRTRGKPIAGQRKGDLFASRKNWQSARSAIRQHAYRVFAESGRELACQVCGYDKHAEIAHFRGVSEFPDSATVAEINDPDNLVALCPNHHWEFDNGLLDLRIAGPGIEPGSPGYEPKVRTTPPTSVA